MKAYAFLLGAILFNVASYILYRSIQGLPARVWWPLFAGGLALGAINTLLFVRALTVVPLSVAYPVFSAVSFAVISIAAAMLFGEKLQAINIVGLVVVVAGVALVAYTP